MTSTFLLGFNVVDPVGSILHGRGHKITPFAHIQSPCLVKGCSPYVSLIHPVIVLPVDLDPDRLLGAERAAVDLEGVEDRAETVAEKPSFRTAFNERRCLVPADGFFEWQGARGSKQPFHVERPDDDLFVFVGLWESWGENGDEFNPVAIITTEPNDNIEPIHDRMPVSLEQDEEKVWLEEEDLDELQALLDPYPSEETDAYEISTAVNNPENDSAKMLEPLGHGQAGLGDSR